MTRTTIRASTCRHILRYHTDLHFILPLISYDASTPFCPDCRHRRRSEEEEAVLATLKTLSLTPTPSTSTQTQPGGTPSRPDRLEERDNVNTKQSEQAKLEALMERLALDTAGQETQREQRNSSIDTYPVGRYSSSDQSSRTSSVGSEDDHGMPVGGYWSTVGYDPYRQGAGQQGSASDEYTRMALGWRMYVHMRMCETGETSYEVAEARVKEMCRWAVTNFSNVC